MAEHTKIQWCDHTFNPWIGCTKIAQGCTACYAEALMDRRYGRVKWGPQGTRVKTKTWSDPLRWNREAAAAGVRRKVFCASLADVFEDRPELEEWRDQLFRLIDQTPSLFWLLLTKRPGNIRQMWPRHKYPNNVWLGTSIATQNDADELVDQLIACSHLAGTLFLSIEPQIEFVNVDPWLRMLDWIIVGGESRQPPYEPRPFNVLWATDLLGRCEAQQVPCFIKQLGSNVWAGKRRLYFEDSHGGNMAEWPEPLRVRQCPETFAAAA